ncbi:MAG: T9SS type A sorting domain-containing protein [Gemmatimonadales bacterium]|nr:MAG: T9SS type A sorting domain-containing protein [Gemmatimonadales bacterium]
MGVGHGKEVGMRRGLLPAALGVWLVLPIAASSLCRAAEWEYLGSIPNGALVKSLDVDPAHGRVLLGTDRGYRILELGSGTWLERQTTDVMGNYKVNCFLPNETDSLALLTGRGDAGWYGYIMDNSGLTTLGPIILSGWDPPPGSGPFGDILGLGRLPEEPATLLACTASDGVLRSTDDGATWDWAHIFLGASGCDLDVTQDGEVLVGYGAPSYPYANHGIARSPDGGDTWEEIAGDMPCAAYIGDVEVDHADPQHIYARQGGIWEPADPALGVYETLDGGQHWTQILQANCMDLSMHPYDAQILVEIENGTVRLTRDSGESWEDIKGNLPAVGGASRCAISSTDERIYIAGSTGVWAMSLHPTAVDMMPAIGSGPIAYPNPFNPKTTLAFSLSRSANATMEILDVQGRLVRRLLEGGVRPVGAQSVSWDGKDDSGQMASSGLYLARLRAGSESSTSKLLFLK